MLGTAQLADDLIRLPFTEPSNRVYRRLNGIGRRWVARAAFALLTRMNDGGTASILGGGPPVSLTTYGRRIPTAFASIESIGLGRVRPSRVVLWVDSADALADLDPRLARLVDRGLEVRLSANFGPHTKYYPYVSELWDGASTLVTADDDIIYPPGWLARLQRASTRFPNDVHCHRAHVVDVQEGAVTSYSSWAPCRSTAPDPRNFATGVSGVIYPRRMLALLGGRDAEFMQACPRADDVWLHFVAVDNGIGVRQVRRQGRHFPVAKNTQVENLQQHNVAGQGNDRQIQATYSTSAIRILSGDRRVTG